MKQKNNRYIIANAARTMVKWRRVELINVNVRLSIAVAVYAD